jgi:hypothetical protein
MKKIKISILACTLFLSLGCENILEEKPQSQIVPSYFNSPAGVLGGIAGVYNEIRNQWGTEGFSSEMQAGTDEFVQGASSGGDYTYLQWFEWYQLWFGMGNSLYLCQYHQRGIKVWSEY